MALSAQEKSFGVWGRNFPVCRGWLISTTWFPCISGSSHTRVFFFFFFFLLLLLLLLLWWWWWWLHLLVILRWLHLLLVFTTISHAHTHAQLPTKSGISLVYPATNNSHNKDYSIFSREDPRCIILRLEGTWKVPRDVLSKYMETNGWTNCSYRIQSIHMIQVIFFAWCWLGHDDDDDDDDDDEDDDEDEGYPSSRVSGIQSVYFRYWTTLWNKQTVMYHSFITKSRNTSIVIITLLLHAPPPPHTLNPTNWNPLRFLGDKNSLPVKHGKSEKHPFCRRSL